MNDRFLNQVIVVTGAAQGIGCRVAARAATEGATGRAAVDVAASRRRRLVKRFHAALLRRPLDRGQRAHLGVHGSPGHCAPQVSSASTSSPRARHLDPARHLARSTSRRKWPLLDYDFQEWCYGLGSGWTVGRARFYRVSADGRLARL